MTPTTRTGRVNEFCCGRFASLASFAADPFLTIRRVQPPQPTFPDRLELGVRLFPRTDVVIGIVVAHFGADNRKLLVQKRVVPEQFELSLLSIFSHGMFGLDHPEHIPGATMSLQEIQRTRGLLCFVFSFAHLIEK